MSGGQKGRLFLSNSGFTLMEILVAISLFGILVAIAIPNWGLLIPTYRLNHGARQVHSDLNLIKMRAAAENVTFQLVFSAAENSYTIQRVVGGVATSLATKPLPDGIDVRTSPTVGFTSRGTADTSAGGTVFLCNTQGAGYNIVVGGTGRVRICRPGACDGLC